MNGISEKGKLILAAMREIRPDSDCLLYFAQAIHESGWFNRVIGKNNVWGIQASRRWQGLRVETVTHEAFRLKEDAVRYHDQRIGSADPPTWDEPAQRWKVRVKRDFRDWSTESAAAAWYFSLLLRYYPGAYYARCSSCMVYGLTHGVGGRKYFTANPERYEVSLDKLHQQLLAETRRAKLL